MTKNFKANEIIFKQGDEGNSFFEIKTGTVAAFADYGEPTEKKLSEIVAGSVIGEIALVDSMPRSATCVAVSDVCAEEITRDEVEEYYKKDPSKVLLIARQLCGTLSRLTDDQGEAAATIAGLFPEGDKRKEGLKDKIQKFVAVYKMNKKYNQKSVEATLEYDEGGVKDSYRDYIEAYDNETIIFKEGENATCMYEVISGWVDIYTGYGQPEEKLIAGLGPGRFFGEIGLIGSSKRTATAVVTAPDTELLRINMDACKKIYEEDPGKIISVLKHLAYRIRVMTNRYLEACALISEVADAEALGGAGKELIARVRAYK